jgi:hypothetical protein
VNLRALLHRAEAGGPRRPVTAADVLVTAAQRRLAVTTLALLVGLLGAVGLTTALLAQQSLDASVDRTLDTAAGAELDRLKEASGTETSEGATPGASADGTETETEGSPAPGQPSVAPGGASDPDDHAPAAADTFFLYLDAGGSVVACPTLLRLPRRRSPAVTCGRSVRAMSACGC